MSLAIDGIAIDSFAIIFKKEIPSEEMPCPSPPAGEGVLSFFPLPGPFTPNLFRRAAEIMSSPPNIL